MANPFRVFILASLGLVTAGCKSPLGRSFSESEKALLAVQAKIDACEQERAKALKEIAKCKAWEATLQLKVAGEKAEAEAKRNAALREQAETTD